MVEELLNPYKRVSIPPEKGEFYIHLSNLNTYEKYHGEYDDLPQNILCSMDRSNPKVTHTVFYDSREFKNAPLYPVSILTLTIHYLYSLGAECIGNNEFRIKTPDEGYFHISIDKSTIDSEGCNFMISFLISSLHPFAKRMLNITDLECETTIGFAYTPMQFLFYTDANEILSYLRKKTPIIK